ncbi:MAG: PhnD/SsuA/transferrin family substrate-binding protein [Paracoccaceae bacterium]
MIACLPIPDWPEMAGATDRYWHLIRDALHARGIDAPRELEKTVSGADCLRHPDLVLGLTPDPVFNRTPNHAVHHVATPDYGHPGCPAGYRRTAYLVRARDSRTDFAAFQDACLAVDAPLNALGNSGFSFRSTTTTGTPAETARAVAEGRADIAATDALSWDLIKRYEDCSLELRVLGWSSPTPGPSYVCGLKTDPETVFAALSDAISRLEIADRRTLRLRGLVRIDHNDIKNAPDP